MKMNARDWRFLTLIVVLFAVSRVFLLWWTQSPDHFFGGDATGDLGLYEQYGNEMVHDGVTPYLEPSPFVGRGIEYPPGSLPFIVAPAVVEDTVSYRVQFTLLMAAVDFAGLAALYVMARRGASAGGMLAWVVLIPLVGPTLYSRLDLVPAVAMIFALERVQARSWYGAGGWLGFGTVAKLTPGFLAPLLFVWSPRRWRVLGGFAVVGALMLMPYVAGPRALYNSVIGYHGERGIEVGSLWGGLIVAGSRLGGALSLPVHFGAVEAENGLAPMLVTLSTALAAVGLLGGTYLAWRIRGADLGDLSLVMLGTMAFLVGVGKVYSAQYIVWLIALGAVALALAGRRARTPAVLLGAIAVLTYWYFPARYIQLLGRRDWPSITVLLARDVLTLVLSGLALWLGTRSLRRRREAAPQSDEDLAALEQDVAADTLVDREDADVVAAPRSG